MTVDWSGLLTDGPTDDADAPGKRWCLACESHWRTPVPCPICDQPGVLASFPPEGWPSLQRPAEAVEPRRTT